MEIRGYPIFRAGKWNGMTFTEEDLDDVIANYNELADVHKVPIKLGHSGERDIQPGRPSLGWISALRRVGSDLLADMSNIPEKLGQAIRDKRYRTTSIELLMGVELGKKIYRHVLDAVAILGCEQPAVVGLGDLDQYLAARATFTKVERTVNVDLPEEEAEDEDPRDDELAQLRAQLAAATTRATAAEARATTAEDAVQRRERDAGREKAERAELARTQRVEMIKTKRGEARTVLETCVTAREITPAQRDYLRRHHRLDDDAAVEALDLTALRPMAIEFGRVSGARLTRAGSVGFSNDPNASADVAPDHDDPSARLTHLTRQHMERTGERDFARALDVVAAANPKLHQQYLLSNGEV